MSLSSGNVLLNICRRQSSPNRWITLYLWSPRPLPDVSDDQTDPGTLEKCAYVLGMIEDCGTPDDAGNLRGEAARALTSYPGNPYLLLLRALSECLVRSPSERSIQEDGDESIRVLSSMVAG